MEYSQLNFSPPIVKTGILERLAKLPNILG